MSAQQPFVTDARGKRLFAWAPVAVQGILVNETEQVLLRSHPRRQEAWEVVSGAWEVGETLLYRLWVDFEVELWPDLDPMA